MSGGVDSAVAAARAVDVGHDVVGVHLALSRRRPRCAAASRLLARRRRRRLPRRGRAGHPVLRVGFAAGSVPRSSTTSSPRTRTGRRPTRASAATRRSSSRGAARLALGLGFDAVCTALRTAVQRGAAPAADASKDQALVSADRRAASARDVPGRRHAQAADPSRGRRHRLRVADKPDSHDICFIPPATPAATSPSGSARPRAVDAGPAGQVLATTVCTSTVGQRRGLGLGQPAADGRPRYVLGIEPASGTVRVGPAEALDVSVIDARRPVWSACRPDGPAAQSQAGGHTEAWHPRRRT